MRRVREDGRTRRASAGRRRSPGGRRRRRLRRRFLLRLRAILLFTAVSLGFCLTVQLGMYVWRSAHGQEDAGTEEAFRRDFFTEEEDGVLVALDAGHGGKDQGTSHGKLLEKDLNLELVRRIKDKLKDSGVSVLLTREGDRSVTLEERAELANREGAELFVSVHCNYCEEDAGVQGLECYYIEESAEGKELAEAVAAGFAEIEEVTNRGTRTADFRVLKNTEMPAVLVEAGYLSNAQERKLLGQEAYQELLAEGVAGGILSCLSSRGML